MTRIIVNAKVYPQTHGQGILDLAAACSTVAAETGIAIGLAPPTVALAQVAALRLPGLEVFAQHTDALTPGAGTGFTTVEAVRDAGAVGSLVNHAEHKTDQTPAIVARLHEVGLQSLVCADGMDETRSLSRLQPTYLAVEPPDLIGGDVSVTSADPRIVSDAARAVAEASPKTRALCGAGVKNGRDVAKALELGAYGVLLASGVVKADDRLAVLRDLAAGT